MKRLLPADKKALAMAAWLFYAERGFDAQLLHHQDAEEIEMIVTAIGNHDEGEGDAVSPLAAALIIADKTDVRRTRVRNNDITSFDIHDKVNYSVIKTDVTINDAKTEIELKLEIDTEISPVVSYFEIFLKRMIMCRKAAQKLGLNFKLVVNNQQLM